MRIARSRLEALANARLALAITCIASGHGDDGVDLPTAVDYEVRVKPLFERADCPASRRYSAAGRGRSLCKVRPGLDVAKILKPYVAGARRKKLSQGLEYVGGIKSNHEKES
ncbi:MAG: hypothetical protein E5X53_19080 [Mesorhizobium sp.]|uniref:hypothetical protein n=1 Tax=Mesorhizobium sp. TaxID=1871066 RepID=UPI001212BF92|nr:hypothetical protein [Mesorhizobium sp.]TIR50635.1 MAG: hypothetical protein E5X53_19080 [Mesorhizobium sp.]